VDALQTAINAVVVTAVGLVLVRLTTNLRQELKADIGRVEVGLKEEIGRVEGGLNAFRAEWKLEMAELRAEIRETRSDLTRVALAVGAERRAGRQEA
jgi:hypothetical protein